MYRWWSSVSLDEVEAWWSDVVLLDVVQHEVKSSCLLAIVSHSDGGAASHLAGDAFLVVLALAEPLAQL